MEILKLDTEKYQGPELNEEGRIGYVIAWLLGVPFWILVLVFLIRGH